jgi:hypothetical protein
MMNATTFSAVMPLISSSISYGMKTIVATNVRYSAHRLANQSPIASMPSSSAYAAMAAPTRYRFLMLTANRYCRSCTMPCLLFDSGPPTPPCRSLRMRVNSAFSAARSLANKNTAAASALRTRKWSSRSTAISRRM